MFFKDFPKLFIQIDSPAKDVPAMVAVDGCEVGCAKAILDHAKIPTKNYLVLTELGIEKNKDFNLKAGDIQKVKAAVQSACK
ncbi:putative zinc-binding protein [Thermodesulfobacteriota bacterium]